MKKSNKKSNNMIDNMYRYLEKFIGTYRVMAEYDLQTNDFPRDEEGNIDKSFEDLYIPCSRGKSVIKHTYDDEVLVICFYDKSSTAKNVFNELKCKYKNIYLEYDDCGTDVLIYFKSGYIGQSLSNTLTSSFFLASNISTSPVSGSVYSKR